jgi:hypothetical protein
MYCNRTTGDAVSPILDLYVTHQNPDAKFCVMFMKENSPSEVLNNPVSEICLAEFQLK